MIDSIFFRSFKGQTDTQKLTGRDIFIGRNGSGKSTRIQATGLSFLGYVPGYGKTEGDTFKLATGEEMAVGLHTSEGFGFERQFSRSTDVSRKTGEQTIKISQSIRVSPGRGETNDTQRKQRIADEVGNFPVMLDINEFLNLSDAKRRDFIYGLSPITSSIWNIERVEAYLKSELLTAELQKNNPDQYQAMEELIHDVMGQFPVGFSVSEGLQAMIDWTTAQLKLWNSKRKDAQGAVRQLADLKNSLDETDRNITAEKVELEELQQKLIQVEKQISQDSEKKKTIDQRLARIQELEKQIADLENAPKDSTNVEKIEASIVELKGKLINADHSEEITNLTAKANAAQQKAEEIQQRVDSLKEQIIQINAGMAGLEKSLETINGLGGHCIVDARIGCEKDFSKFHGFVEQKRVEATEIAKKLRSEYEAAVAEQKGYRDEENDARNSINDLLTKERQNNASNRSINNMLANLERQRNEAITADERRGNQIKLLQDELTRLMNQPAEAIAPLDALQQQATGIRNRIAELKASVDEKTKARQTIILMQQSMLENRNAELRFACLKSLSESLGPKGIQGEIVKEILDPIKSDIRGNLKTMGFDFEPFFQMESDTGKEIFQFGWINEKGHYVNFDALSTGQQTIFLAAMMMVIIDRAQPKLRILVMDNLNHLDRQNFQMMISGLSQLAPKLDNIILAGAIEFPFEADGWKVWNLSQEAAEDDRKVA